MSLVPGFEKLRRQATVRFFVMISLTNRATAEHVDHSIAAWSMQVRPNFNQATHNAVVLAGSIGEEEMREQIAFYRTMPW
jgi:hypothetical protein